MKVLLRLTVLPRLSSSNKGLGPYWNQHGLGAKLGQLSRCTSLRSVSQNSFAEIDCCMPEVGFVTLLSPKLTGCFEQAILFGLFMPDLLNPGLYVLVALYFCITS